MPGVRVELSCSRVLACVLAWMPLAVGVQTLSVPLGHGPSWIFPFSAWSSELVSVTVEGRKEHLGRRRESDPACCRQWECKKWHDRSRNNKDCHGGSDRYNPRIR